MSTKSRRSRLFPWASRTGGGRSGRRSRGGLPRNIGRCETLEPRRLLASVIDLSSGALTVDEAASAANNYSIMLDAGDFLITDPGNPINTTIAGATGSGTDTVRIPTAGVTSIEFNAGDGDDIILGGDAADFVLSGDGDDLVDAGLAQGCDHPGQGPALVADRGQDPAHAYFTAPAAMPLTM